VRVRISRLWSTLTFGQEFYGRVVPGRLMRCRIHLSIFSTTCRLWAPLTGHLKLMGSIRPNGTISSHRGLSANFAFLRRSCLRATCFSELMVFWCLFWEPAAAHSVQEGRMSVFLEPKMNAFWWPFDSPSIFWFGKFVPPLDPDGQN